MVVRTFQQLLSYLDDAKVPHVFDASRHTVEIPRRDVGLPGNACVVWPPATACLQIMVPIVADVPRERGPEVAVVLALVNHRLALGSCGWDEAERRVYARISIPVFPSDGWNAVALATLLRALTTTAIEARSVLLDVIAGTPASAALQAPRPAPASGEDA